MSCNTHIKRRCKGWSFIDHVSGHVEYGKTFLLVLRNFTNLRITGWPVVVFNIDGEEIGVANTRKEFIELWNSDERNQTLGYIKSGWPGDDFGFRLTVVCGAVPPQWLLATSNEEIGIITEDGQQILMETGESIIQE